MDTTASKQLISSLENLDNSATVQGRDAKLLREAATVTLTQSTQQRYVALRKLSACRQVQGESCLAFADRVLNLVRAPTSGQDIVTQKERVLEEFVVGLRGDIRYFVKLDNPTPFEQAIIKAQTVEHLLTEATSDRFINLV
ncbi:hypothetical protein ANCDUO_18506 [Ancylostoma duodenale]|uniref:Uncharacterized protein n=1 Tax=Ancylostoma duodenale TaxID=51022 RepID=A0A0C2FXQ8_9BILA|nr:hypothetical protein ANCDUO_18506 [Ancylostoma duodenale]